MGVKFMICYNTKVACEYVSACFGYTTVQSVRCATCTTFSMTCHSLLFRVLVKYMFCYKYQSRLRLCGRMPRVYSDFKSFEHSEQFERSERTELDWYKALNVKDVRDVNRSLVTDHEITTCPKYQEILLPFQSLFHIFHCLT